MYARSFLGFVKAFLAAHPLSIKGVVSGAEKAQALILALATGNVAGIVAVVLSMVGLNVPAATVAGIVTIVTYVVDYFRRRNQGVTSAVIKVT